MLKPGRLLVVTFTAIALAGCSAAPRTFRLVESGSGSILVPPGVRNAAAASRTLRVRRGSKKRVCAPSAGGLRVRKQALAVTRESLGASSSEELTRWIAALEADGCISAPEAADLTTTILNALPLDLSLRRKLRGDLSAVQGSFDLTASTSLRVVSPVYRPGAAPTNAIAGPAIVSAGIGGGLDVELRASTDLIGYEVAWYEVTRREDGPGLRILPARSEVHVGGQVENSRFPQMNRLELDPAARWFRYFVMTRASRNDYNIVVLGGQTKAELELRAEAFRKDAAGFLKASPKSSYAAMTGEIGVNPYLRVTVNGIESFAALGSSAGQAIDQAAEKAGTAQAAKTLSIRKPYGGGLALVVAERGKQDLLNLPLEGGEQISWSY